MNHFAVRIESIEIRNFKNVKYGMLNFKNTRKPYRSSILGLYGQNGSGKTALIDALCLLKYALTSRPAPAVFADYIHVDADRASLKYEFTVKNHETEGEYTVFYEFNIGKDLEEPAGNIHYAADEADRYRTVIFDEVLSYSYRDSAVRVRLLPIVDTRTEAVFVPGAKYHVLAGKGRATETSLLVAKRYARETSRTFVFSREMLDAVRKNCKEPYHVSLFESLVWFGAYELFIINTANSGLIAMDALPLAFRYEEKNRASSGSLMLPLSGVSTILKEDVDMIKKVVENMNIVLSQIIPGLTISVREWGEQYLKNGKNGCRIQLISHRNNREIPLQYESEGIKKIISILQLLIVVYNQESITVAVDELDSGVFEYLLGELLRIISEKGRGQLIFTSHNLRPLETLDRGFIAFTTTNPDNRYIRLGNGKADHNFRDFYYQDIVLGQQSEEIYEPTDNYEIALAFREAGELGGT